MKTTLLETQVAETLKYDGMKDKFLNMSESERIEAVRAYALSEVKKFRKFQVKLLTNEQARNAFNSHVLSCL